MAFGLQHTIHDIDAAIQQCAAAYAKAVAEQDVLAAFAAAQKLSEVAEAAVAIFVVVTGALVGARAETEEPHP